MHGMRRYAALVVVLLILAAPLLQGGALHGDWRWDLTQAAGYASLALFAATLVVPGVGVLQPRHRRLGETAAMLLAAHVLCALVLEPWSLYYLSWESPAYMLAGIAAVGCVAALLLTSYRPVRLRSHGSYSAFTIWHRTLAVGTALLTLWHVLGSRLFLSPSTASLVVLAMAIALLPTIGRSRWPTGRRVLAVTLLALAVIPAFLLLGYRS
ncbi:MAG: ferric reductase-like transmembrane domain-containing protein [Pseudomonadota bacterium]